MFKKLLLLAVTGLFLASCAATNTNQGGDGDISISANTATIKSGESSNISEFGSKTTNASISVGSNGVGYSGGYNQSDATGFIKLNALRLRLGAKRGRDYS